jgi:hypothetical protein
VHVIGIFATYHRQCSDQLIGRIIDKDVAQGATKRIFDPAGFIRQGGLCVAQPIRTRQVSLRYLASPDWLHGVAPSSNATQRRDTSLLSVVRDILYSA